eukprot:197165_1
MSTCNKLFWWISLIVWTVYSQSCKFGNLDLGVLSNSTIYCEQENKKYVLYFSPCRNGLGCEGQVMVGQYSQNNNGQAQDCMYNVASFNQSVQPSHNSAAKSYLFEYKNGHDDVGSQYCYNGRYINITFICEPNAIPYDKNKTKCDDASINVGVGICPYYFNVYTNSAC